MSADKCQSTWTTCCVKQTSTISITKVGGCEQSHHRLFFAVVVHVSELFSCDTRNQLIVRNFITVPLLRVRSAHLQ